MEAPKITNASDLLPAAAPRVGFGCGDLFGGTSHAASVRLVEAALDAGVCYFDVARLYGNGTAENVLGRVLPRVRDRVIIASKAGILPWSMLLWSRLVHKAAKTARSAGHLARTLVPPPRPAKERYGAFQLRDLTRSVDRSLRALRTDYLDILLLHECSLADTRRPETLRFLEGLRARGKIRWFGIATHFPSTLEILRDVPEVASVAQFASNALNRNVAQLPAGWAGLVVTHTAMKQVLPRLIDHLAGDAAARSRWVERTGIEPDDRSAIGRLLLADAVAENAAGVVLFSTSRPERIREAVAVANFGESAARLAALRDEIAFMQAKSAAL